MLARYPILAHTISLVKSRLSRRIALLVTLSLLLIEAAILVPSYLNLQSKLYRSLEQDVLRTVQFALATPDPKSIKGSLERSWRSLQSTGVEGLAIYDGTGNLLIARGQPVHLMPEQPLPAERKSSVGATERSAGGAAAEATQRRFRQQHGYFAIFWPPETLDRPYAVSARLSTEMVDKELWAFVLRIGGLVMLLACFVSAATIAILSREVLAPVLAIHRNLTAAHADPERAESYKLDIRSRDEIGETVTALNALLDRLSDLRRRDLRDEQQRFKDFAKSSSDWFWEMDRELRFSFFSDRFTEVTGVDERELLGKTRQETGIPGVDEGTWQQHLDDLANRRAFRNFTHPRQKQDGEVVWLSISGTPSFAEDGTFLGYRGTGRDITAEIELQSSLRSAKDLAEAANRTKSEFLANMSHELRTPLNAIIGFSELIQATLPKETDNPQFGEYLNDILDAAHHLLSLINDILDLSKIEAGASELNEEVVNIVAIAESVIRVVGQRAKKAGVFLTFEPAADLPPVYADERKLKQALLNLVTNAVKFTEEGGTVTLRIDCADSSGHTVQVVDSGIGMATEDIPKAMRKFGQVDSDLNRKYEGTGLGLPLTKALAELHEGSLDLQSAVGKGTTATLHLPSSRIVRDEPTASPEPQPAEGPRALESTAAE